MTPPSPPPVFLQRDTYRRRRLADAVKLLPFVGAILWALPMSWRHDDQVSSAGGLYIFGVWVVLIVLAVVLSRIGLHDQTPQDGAARDR